MDSMAFDEALGIKHNSKKRARPFKLPTEDNRIFPNYFADVIVSDGKDRIFEPMRYRVRPNGSREEVPTKFNVFNARIDALEERKTWTPLFMNNHALIPFTNFYEWVLGPNGKPKLITFIPEGRDVMWAPCLWDEWISKDGKIHFKSFAIITDGPPKEIEIMGHDRCPIFINEEYIDEWLNPKSSNKNEIYEILKQKENVKYRWEWVENSAS
jgi:putative SOS response-associated peptidase YedK